MGKKESVGITLTLKQRDVIIKYIVDYSKHIPYETKSTSKYQVDTGKITKLLGIV